MTLISFMPRSAPNRRLRGMNHVVVGQGLAWMTKVVPPSKLAARFGDRKSKGQALSKTVVVTGASTGIGFATSLVLAKAGYDVFAGVRSLSAGAPLMNAAAGFPGKITPILLEVADSDEAGHLYRYEAGRRSDLKPAMVPI